MNVAVKQPLEAAAVRETVVELEARIASRFSHRRLKGVAGDLLLLIDQVQAGASDTQSRVRALRALSRVAMVVIAGATALALAFALRDALLVDGRITNSLHVLPLIETVINDVVFAGIAVFFLYSFPERLRRGQLLKLLFQLRSTAHIIDMHQLSKDPEQLRPSYVPTHVSKPLELTRDEMERYLDYCSELLSLVGKAAALCAQESRDPLVLETVAQIEALTVSLSRKIWQKISNLPPPDDIARHSVGSADALQ